jgi:hypothetical protein
VPHSSASGKQEAGNGFCSKATATLASSPSAAPPTAVKPRNDGTCIPLAQVSMHPDNEASSPHPPSAAPATEAASNSGPTAALRHLLHAHAVASISQRAPAGVTPSNLHQAVEYVYACVAAAVLQAVGWLFLRVLVAIHSSGLLDVRIPVRYVHKYGCCQLEAMFEVPLLSADDRSEGGLKIARLAALKVLCLRSTCAQHTAPYRAVLQGLMVAHCCLLVSCRCRSPCTCHMCMIHHEE